MKHVLLVEDNRTDRFILRSIVEKLGHAVHEVVDGIHVENSLKKIAPDLVLLDLFMPEKEGVETLELLKDYNESLPVIVVSSGADDYGKQLVALGAHSCHQKPIDTEKLVAAIKELIG